MKKMTWTILDHLCKSCGGRILQSASGAGPTPGGNPVFKCADCGQATSGTGPEVLCWCGFSHRGQHPLNGYRCLPFSILQEKPELKDAFLACGRDPRRGEVGIILKGDLK